MGDQQEEDRLQTVSDELLQDERERRHSRKITLQQEADDQDLHDVLSTPEGRAVLYRVLGKARVFGISYSPGSFDRTSFNEGARNLGLWLLSDIMRVSPGTFELMKKEAGSKEIKEEIDG